MKKKQAYDEPERDRKKGDSGGVCIKRDGTQILVTEDGERELTPDDPLYNHSVRR